MTIEQIVNKVKENDKNANTDLLVLAYDFAKKAHGNQRRKSGDPYIEHSLQTAYLLAQMKADLNTVIAGLLHDVPEDTEISLDEIYKNFGDEVGSLVQGITKLGKLKYRGVERYRESLRKMFIAMAQDIKVILIKFCDRLHNLKTLDVQTREKQIRIAQETMEIFVPIADLLGIWRLKWQMEDLCFKYLHPEDFKKIEFTFEVEQKQERLQYIQKIKNILEVELKKNNIDGEITGRLKHLYSIYKKMQNKERKFSEIYDVFALRIIVPTVGDCYKALGIIHSLWRPIPHRFKDYIAVPKPNGYRSLHTTVFGPEGKPTEFQIRTHEMHEEALYGIAAHWYYKHKEFENTKVELQPNWVSEILEIQREAKSTTDFINEIKFNVFKNRIFVFSPKGDVFDLPAYSTPVDFAYKVHTDIGNHITSATVNDKMVPLDHGLKSGDIIEVKTDKSRKGPNKEWLKFVKTHRAKSKIKQCAPPSTLDHLKNIIPGMKNKN